MAWSVLFVLFVCTWHSICTVWVKSLGNCVHIYLHALCFMHFLVCFWNKKKLVLCSEVYFICYWLHFPLSLKHVSILKTRLLLWHCCFCSSPKEPFLSEEITSSSRRYLLFVQCNEKLAAPLHDTKLIDGSFFVLSQFFSLHYEERRPFIKKRSNFAVCLHWHFLLAE